MLNNRLWVEGPQDKRALGPVEIKAVDISILFLDNTSVMGGGGLFNEEAPKIRLGVDFTRANNLDFEWAIKPEQLIVCVFFGRMSINSFKEMIFKTRLSIFRFLGTSLLEFLLLKMGSKKKRQI